MNNLAQTIFIGICFGIWPFIMNKSGLDDRISPILAAVVALIMTTFNFFYLSNGKLTEISLKGLLIGCLASFVCSIGVIKFYKTLSNNSLVDFSIVFIIITVIQVSISALVGVIMSGEISINKFLGFSFGVLAVYFLNK